MARLHRAQARGARSSGTFAPRAGLAVITAVGEVHRAGSSPRDPADRNLVSLLRSTRGTSAAREESAMSRTSVMTGSTELAAHTISGVAGTAIGVIAGLQSSISAEAVSGIVAVIAATTLALLKVLQTE